MTRVQNIDLPLTVLCVSGYTDARTHSVILCSSTHTHIERRTHAHTHYNAHYNILLECLYTLQRTNKTVTAGKRESTPAQLNLSRAVSGWERQDCHSNTDTYRPQHHN